MKILNCFLDNRFGGPQRRAHIIAQQLKRCNIETVFLFNERLKGNLPIENVKCFLVKHTQCMTVSSFWQNLFMFLLMCPHNLYKICRIIKREEIDIVHVNGIMNILPVLAAKLTKAKVLWHLNDTQSPWIVKKLCLRPLELCSDKIAVTSKSVSEYYLDSDTKLHTKPVVLGVPIDMTRFNPDAIGKERIENLKHEFNIVDGASVVGTIGNVNAIKGYEYFIKAAQIVKKKTDNVKFLIVGAQLHTQRKLAQKLQATISDCKLDNDIIFTGFREDIQEVLSVMDVFVLSSVSESGPLVVLEAMAMKVPVVATDVGLVSELLINNETGIMVELRNPQQIARGVLELLNKPKMEIEKMVNKARLRTSELFSLEKISEQHKQVYETIHSKS
jgi:glycosyltransferase involved in cell wall biosynthesis